MGHPGGQHHGPAQAGSKPDWLPRELRRQPPPPQGPLPQPWLCPVSPGLDIHFIHVKPPNLPSGQTPKPLLMVHGWPGSFYEFYKIIPLLTDPKNHGLSDEHVFEVICPSIPGYGFSEASSKKGMGLLRAGHLPQGGEPASFRA